MYCKLKSILVKKLCLKLNKMFSYCRLKTQTELQMSIDKNKMQGNKTQHAVRKLLMTAVMTPHWKFSLAMTAGGKLLGWIHIHMLSCFTLIVCSC